VETCPARVSTDGRDLTPFETYPSSKVAPKDTRACGGVVNKGRYCPEHGLSDWKFRWLTGWGC